MVVDKISSTICLDYSNKELCKFPEDILVYKNLRMLCLDGNELTILPDTMYLMFNHLTWLDVRNNKLTTISPKIGKCRFLETLLIQDNCIQQLPKELGVIENLKTLQLSGNPIIYPSPQILELGICGIIQYLKGEYDTMGKNEKIIKKVRKLKKKINSSTTSNSITKKLKPKIITKRKSIKKMNKTVIVEENVNVDSNEIINNFQEEENKYLDIGINEKSIVSQNKDRGDVVMMATTSTKKSIPKLKKIIRKPTGMTTGGTTKIRLLPKRNSDRYLERTNLKRSMLRAKERSLKDIWTNRLRILLERQASIIQRRQTIEALKNWRRQVDKFNILSKDNEKLVPSPPFDVDEKFLKMPTRTEYQTQLTTNTNNNNRLPQQRSSSTNIMNTKCSGKYKRDEFSSKIDEVIASIKALDRLNNSTMLTPTQEQKLLESEIKKLNDIQKTLSSLKLENERELMI